jgi:hypothetical protein
MIPGVGSFSEIAGPPSAAPLALHYPQFKPTEIPLRRNAVAAWMGTLQPFRDNQTAREGLRCLEANEPIGVCAGMFSISDEDKQKISLRSHWAEPMLLNMDMAFTVLVLESSGHEHPRAFAAIPQVSRLIFPRHPHLLDGISVQIRGRKLPALCVYSGAQFRYSMGLPNIVEFLDQLTTYLARHLIWRRTRRLFEVAGGRVKQIYSPRPGELILDTEPQLRTDRIGNSGARPIRFWDGYWPGTVAPQGPDEHLRTIRPEQECWCCSGDPYGECCLPRDLLNRTGGSGLRY